MMKKYCPGAIKFILLPLVVLAFLSSLFATQNGLVFAQSETFNLQGKIVRNDTGNEGLNVVAGSPTCVFLGPSNDTCDFRVEYYSAATGGTLLGTEVFSNVEIGEYNGIFNLALGTGSFTAGSESSFRNIFLNNTSTFVEIDFAPDGSTYTETFLQGNGDRMAVRAAPYAISSSGANKQFQFDVNNSDSGGGYSNIGAGQVYYDGTNNVLRLYNGTDWLAVQAAVGDVPTLWDLNDAETPNVIYSYTGLDVAFGGDDSTAPFFYDVSAQLLTLTNTTGGNSFRVNDQASDTTPFIIDAAGRVGIGVETVGSANKLEVVGGRTLLKASSEAYALGLGRTDGAGNMWLGVTSSATPDLQISNNAGTTRLIISDTGALTQIGANDSEISFNLRKGSVDSTHIQWSLAHQSNNQDLYINAFNGSSTKNFMQFYWTSEVTNFAAGRVGIGVTDPSAWLGIKAATTSYAQLNLASSDGTDPASPVSGDMWWNGTNLYFFDGTSTEDLLAGGGGGGGLFTDGGSTTYLTATTDNLALGGTDSSAPFFFDAGNELLTLTNTTSGLSFRVNDEAGDTTPFVIDADGNVGIGTATPGARLDIAGSTGTITNTSGDITINAASGTISFAGDSITNVLNGTFSGDVVLNGGQLQLGNHASNPTAIGEGSVVYNSTEKILYYNNGTVWSEVGKVYSGTSGQTLRHDGTDWIASSALVNDGTNVTMTGQVRVGNYASKPGGIGAGALVYDTALSSLFVYDGTDWKAISTGKTHSTEGVVDNGSYLQLTHNENSFDVVASAWVKAGSQWKHVQDVSNTIDHDLANEFNARFAQKKKVQSVKIAYNENNLGNGADGAITVSSDTSINATSLISGRSCADGGDAVNYSVTALSSNSATLESAPSTGCISVGDEVLLINLRGVYAAFPNVGNYETLRVASVSSNTVTFVGSKTKFYGDGASDDTNIGLGDGNQTVMLQRVPNYTNVTVSGSGTDFYPDSWTQPAGAVHNGQGEGGVMFFRASGTVNVGSGSLILATSRGYFGGIQQGGYSYGGAQGGEAFCGIGGNGGSPNTNGSDGAGGGGGGYSTGNGGSGSCGGGGGTNATVGSGSATAGGSGGGGGIRSGGGGGGYGAGGAGGYQYNQTQQGVNGGTNSSGNGGYGGGGGGTYGSQVLDRLYLGSGGGRGGNGLSPQIGGAGGYGGGIIYIAANTVTISGAVTAAGGNGSNGACTTAYYTGGGGGASGGSIKIMGNYITMGSSSITAGGGNGGNGCNNGSSVPNNGGAGGVGRIAVYHSVSVSGTTSPTYYGDSLEYYLHAIYVGKEIPTPQASSYNSISWTQNLPTGTEIQVQTRSGSTPNSTDGTWEGWKPITSLVSLDDANTHTNWSGTNMTVADGDVVRNIDYFEDEDENTSGNLTKGTATAANGYAEATISSTDLSSYQYISLWVRSSLAGNSMKVGFGESAGNEQEEMITIDKINTWQKVYWEISDISGTDRDGVTKLRITSTQNGAVLYFDNVVAETNLSDHTGSAITSTVDDYLQYRFILTTTDVLQTPTLSNVKINITNPSGAVDIDADRVRVAQDVDYYDSERLNIVEVNLDESKSRNVQYDWDSVSSGTEFSVGDGSDGSITVSSNTSINTTSLSVGRSCSDGGDAVNYSVTSLGLNYAMLESSPSSGCLSVGDEVLIINLRGTYSAFGNVGNYETLHIESVVSNKVTFTKAKSKFYGDNANDDSNIGLGDGSQAVMLQRVPNYENVTVTNSSNFYPDSWEQPGGSVHNGQGEGGVMFFRASGTVSVASGSSIHANGLGYKGGTQNAGYNYGGGQGGEAFCGGGGNGVTTGTAGSGSAGGGGYSVATGGSGYCGGGGGASTPGTGSAAQGGAGGGGGTYSGGGGAGHGTAATGGAAYNNTTRAPSGGTNSSGNGVTYGGGGGGTYGLQTLDKLYFGSGGGRGGNNASPHLGGAGGNGGGIINIAVSSITISGSLSASGQNGSNGTCSSGHYTGGGGGAAGGSLKLLGRSLNLGSSVVLANGGGAGSGCENGAVRAGNGGTGGVGRIAVSYTVSITGSTSPAAYTASIETASYSVFTSDEIPTMGATGYNQLSWLADTNKYGKIAFQTRSGPTPNATDGSWEAWKPAVNGANILDLHDADDHTDWVGTGLTVGEGDTSRNVDHFEDEDEMDEENITKLTSTSSDEDAQVTITPVNISTYDYITFWIRASQKGNTVKIGFGENDADEYEQEVHITHANTWQKIYWDISAIPAWARDGVSEIRVTNLSNSANTIYIDNFTADRYMKNPAGTNIASTPNNYIQYRAILTTTDPAFRPVLHNIRISYSSGYRIELTDADTARVYNYSGEQQELKLTVSSSGGSSGSSSVWTESGGNVYRGTGKVGIGDSTPDVELKVVGALCVRADASDCAGATPGTIYANNTSLQNADLAEKYKVTDFSIEEGDLVSFSQDGVSEIEKTNLENLNSLMGVVSTAPGLIMNDNDEANYRAVGLIGRVPVKVITASKSILKGDSLTGSPINGFAIASDRPGYTVGRSLESTLEWAPGSVCPRVDSIENIKWPEDKGQNEKKPCYSIPVLSLPKETREELAKYSIGEEETLIVGKVMAYVNASYSQPTWMTNGLAKLMADYESGRLGGESSWDFADGRLVTNEDVYANSFNATRGAFSILSGGMLNIADGNLIVDGSGNMSVAGDLLLAGRAKGSDGSFIIELGDSNGESLFAIKNSNDETVFSIDSKGQVGGKGVLRTEWLKVKANSSIEVEHKFGGAPSGVEVFKSDKSDGSNFTTKGLGSEYYYEAKNDNVIEVLNKTGKDIWVRLTIQK